MTHSHLADLLDLDADVLHDLHREVIAWVTAGRPPRPHVIDLGAGTGTGALALARHLPDATVTAVDVDEEMLAHLSAKAAGAGLGDRVRTVRADLDGDWPALGPADLVWASASLHHLADPGAALRRVRDMLAPDGAVAVTELDSFPRFLPGGPEAALEDRCHAVLAAIRTEAGMHMDRAWGDRLTAAGLTVEAERRFDVDLRPPLPPSAGRYAEVTFARMRHGLEDRLGADDRAALDALAAGIAERDDLVVRTVRTVWLARRPS